MMSRRFVNLAMANCNNFMVSLHRLDVSKHLFYPSTAEAETAGGRVEKQGKPPKIMKLRLPPSIMGFEPFSTRDLLDYPITPYDSNFVLLHDPNGRSSSEASRILFTNSEGQATMYDLDSRSVISVPDLSVPGPWGDIPIATGAGAGEESLYMMRSGGSFEVLDFSSSSSLRWKALPQLPKADDNVRSFTVVDGGRIICLSSAGREDKPTTFCFDTVSQEWWRAGDWSLPFQGRAEYVPELDTWLGFSHEYRTHNLCAADLSGVAMAPRLAPTLQHVWDDYNPPLREVTSLVLNKDYPNIVLKTAVDWRLKLMQLFLVNLGSGRFCVAKVLEGQRSVSISCSFDKLQEEELGMFMVLTGVEVIRDGGDGELRMVKHKSRQLVHPGLKVACVL